jgi:hypothetical protein
MGNEFAVKNRDGRLAVALPAHRRVTYLVGSSGQKAGDLLRAFAKAPRSRSVHYPVLAGKEKAAGNDPLGGIWRAAYARKNDLTTGKPVVEVDAADKGTHCWLKVVDEGQTIVLGSHGPATGKAGYDNCATLVFTPPAPGTFSLEGGLRAKGQNKSVTRFQIGVLNGNGVYRELHVKALSASRPSETLDGQKVVLEMGERLLLSAYRTASHYWSELTLSNLKLARSRK